LPREILNYNIHDIFKMRMVRNKTLDLLRDINLRFSYFQVDEIDRPDLTINIGRFEPSNRGCYLVDRKYEVRDGYLHCWDSEERAKWEFEILGLEEDETTLNFNGSVLGLHQVVYPHIFAQNLVGRSLLEYKLSQQDYFLIHAASVVRDKRAFLLVGRGGANKTSVTMDLVRGMGFEFQGDDWVILHRNRVLSFPTHFQEFNFRVQHLPTEGLRGLRDKLRLVRHLNQAFDYGSAPISVKGSCRLATIVLLLKTNSPQLQVEEVDSGNALERLLVNNMLEETITSLSMGVTLQGFAKSMLAYSFVFPNSALASYWKRVREGLGSIVQGVPCYAVRVPHQYSRAVAEEIRDLLTGS